MIDRIPPTTPDGPIDWEALARYLAGESGPEEAEEIERWLEAQPLRANLVGALDRMLDSSRVSGPADVDVEAALAVTNARISTPPVRAIGTARSARAPRPGPGWPRTLARAAAIGAVLLGSAVVFSRLDREPGVDFQVARVHETPTAVLDSLVLADGTRVTLAPRSRLTVLAGYGDAARELALEGEAMFVVTHDDDRPFLVHVGGGVVQDLGTAFSVRTGTPQGVIVSVTDGAVRLRAEGAPAAGGVILNRGDRGTMGIDGATTVERGAATDDDVAWTRGVLVFRDTPLVDVVADLQRWYGLDFQLAGTDLAERRLTATFRGETAEEVAAIIALALGGRTEVRGDTIVIHPTERP